MRSKERQASSQGEARKGWTDRQGKREGMERNREDERERQEKIKKDGEKG